MQKQFSYKLNNIDKASLKLAPSSLQDYSNEKNELSTENKKEILGEVGTLTEDEFKQLVYEVLSPINYNLMVTPTEIDFMIERLATLLASGINKSLHKHFNPTKNQP